MDKPIITEELKYMYDDVKDWLKFAEAKNAALLTFNAALIIGLLKYSEGTQTVFQSVPYYFDNIVLFSCLSIIILLVSFTPQVKIPWLLNAAIFDKNNNLKLRFFGDITKLTPTEFLKQLYIRYIGEKVGVIPALELDLAEQIVILSGITLRKFKLFNFALWLTIFGIFTPIVGMICLVIYFSLTD